MPFGLSLEAITRMLDEVDVPERFEVVLATPPLNPCAEADAAHGRLAALHAASGSYDVEGWRMETSADVRAMVDSPAHRELVAGGCCHFLGPAVVTVSGDLRLQCASRWFCYVFLGRQQALSRERRGCGAAPSEYVVWRASANHFELARNKERWEITKRSSRTLNGSTEAHELLSAGLAGEQVSLR